MTVEQALAEVLKDQIFFDQSRGGVTVSGGEPLMQGEFVEALLTGCHERGVRTVLDTCGFAKSGMLRKISRHVDLFLYDLKVMDSEKHWQVTGVPNEMILSNLRMLAELARAVIVRIPVIPGVNDDLENIDAVSKFLSSTCLRRIDLLPFHKIGSDKYRRLHLTYEMNGTRPPSPRQLQDIAARLRSDGFTVRIGG